MNKNFFLSNFFIVASLYNRRTSLFVEMSNFRHFRKLYITEKKLYFHLFRWEQIIRLSDFSFKENSWIAEKHRQS